jgi:hypothetical protein
MELVLKEGLLIQKVVDEVVLLEPESGDYYTLNEMGALMLELFQQGRSINEISSNISGQFDVASNQVEEDFDQLMRGLQDSGLAIQKNA